MQQRFDKQLAALLGNNGEKGLLLAVSGGVDSMCLAHLALHSSLKSPLAIAHVNFNLRGDESDGDEALVAQFATEHNITFYHTSVDTVAYAKEHSVSIEMAARTLRYEWFANLKGEHGFEAVAVAHNANDSAETLFLNLLRGTGIKGLCGIRSRNGIVIRPMLEFTRSEILEYVLAHNIPYRNDSTNNDSKYHRNHIRNVIFPEAEKINPAYLATLTTEMGYFSQVNCIIDSLFEEKKMRFYSEENGVAVVDIAPLEAEEHFSYWLFKIMEPLGFNPAQIKQTESCILSKTQSGKHIDSATHTALFDRGKIKLYPISSVGRQGSVEGSNSSEGVPFAPTNNCTKESYKIKVYPKPTDFNPKGGYYLDGEGIGIECGEYDITTESSPLYCREWLPADKFVPYGMKGGKKVSDFLTDLKMDLIQKRSQKVIVLKRCGSAISNNTEKSTDRRTGGAQKNQAEQIVFVAGRTSDRFKITEKTKTIAEIVIG